MHYIEISLRVDTSVRVKDHLDNVIMQMTGLRRKCLILSLLYKKKNIGKCPFLIAFSPLAGHPLSSILAWAGVKGVKCCCTSPSIVGFLRGKLCIAPCFVLFQGWRCMLTLPFLEVAAAGGAAANRGDKSVAFVQLGRFGPLWYCSALIPFKLLF